MSKVGTYIKKLNLNDVSKLNKTHVDLILQRAYQDFKGYQIDIDDLSILCEELLCVLIKTDVRYESFELWTILQNGALLRLLLRRQIFEVKNCSFTEAFLAFETYIRDMNQQDNLSSWCK